MDTRQIPTDQNSMENEVLTQQGGTNNSRLFLVVAMSVLLTAVLAGSAVYFWQKSANEKTISRLEQKISSLEEQVSTMEEVKIPPQPTLSPAPSPTPITDQTADWKVHSSSHFGFSMKYPVDLALDVDTSEENLNLIFEPNTNKAFVFQANNNNEYDSLIIINTAEALTIGDVEWKISRLPSRTVDFGYRVPGGGPFYVLQAKNNNHLYAWVIAGESLTEEQNQILSTFKFLK